MNKSIIRHLLTAVVTVVGLIPSTKVLMPAMEYISNNLDSVWTAGGVLIGSVLGLIQAFKFGREK